MLGHGAMEIATIRQVWEVSQYVGWSYANSGMIKREGYT